MNIVTPTIIGSYKVLFRIGTGSFSEVYHGIDTRDHKVVAMKFVDRKNLQNPALLSVFERELRISQRVCHKNIVKIYDTVFTEKFIILVIFINSVIQKKRILWKLFFPNLINQNII